MDTILLGLSQLVNDLEIGIVPYIIDKYEWMYQIDDALNRIAAPFFPRMQYLFEAKQYDENVQDVYDNLVKDIETFIHTFQNDIYLKI
jgi:hypothetical protein